MEQRNGRIIRQGNMFDKVGVYNYVTENTFDAYMMNIIVTKQKFISQLMSGKTPARTCEDVDEMVLNYSEMQALATGDPRIKEKIELDNDVSRLRTLESEHLNNRYKLQDIIRTRTSDLSIAENRLEAIRSDKKFVESLPADEEFSVTLNGALYTERTKAAEVIAKEITTCLVKHETKNIGEYQGFEINLSSTLNGTSQCPLISLRHNGGIEYSAYLTMENNTGNITRMENIIKTGIDKELARCEERIDRDKSDISQAQNTITQPFEFAEELKQKTARLEQLNAELDVGKSDEIFVEDEEDRSETENISQKPQSQKKAVR